MIKRLTLLALLFWIGGFAAFAVFLPKPHEGGTTDGVIVLTGDVGRIERGLFVLRKGWAKEMLVSGVDRDVRPREFEIGYKVPRQLMKCCVTLGFEATDTQSNAREAARWIARRNLRSVRLVTTDWHMRRAAYDLEQMRPAQVAVIEDAVPSRPVWRTLFTEYHKLLARRAARLWGS